MSLHDNQLLRYFHTSSAKFGVLTNGVEYHFYTDLEVSNKMDEKPFLKLNMLDLKDNHIDELKKFHKSYFDVGNILSSASELKYTGEFKSVIQKELNSPSPELVKLISKQVYDGIITAKILEQFSFLDKKAFNRHINDIITDTLKSALSNNKPNVSEVKEEEENEHVENNKAVVTTVEELEAYTIVKSIVRIEVDLSRVIYKDTLSYFGISLDNTRKTICRLYFNGKKKYITTMDENKKETRFDIENLDDIYKYSDDIIKSLKLYGTNNE